VGRALDPTAAFELCVRLSKVLEEHPSASVFLDPVPAEYEDYYATIATPMCISMAVQRLNQHKQGASSSSSSGGGSGGGGGSGDSDSTTSSLSSSAGVSAALQVVRDFVKDVRLIWANCTAYNAAGSDIYRQAIELRDHFEYHLTSAADDDFPELEVLVYKRTLLPDSPPRLSATAKRMRLQFFDVLDGLIARADCGHLARPRLSREYLAKVEEPLDLTTMRHRVDWCVEDAASTTTTTTVVVVVVAAAAAAAASTIVVAGVASASGYAGAGAGAGAAGAVVAGAGDRSRPQRCE
jgi:hypothetical protein